MEKLDIHATDSLTRYAIGTGMLESRVQMAAAWHWKDYT